MMDEDEYKKEIAFLKIDRGNKVFKLRLETLDEIEITTPSGFWVIGCDGEGELVIGETQWNPHLLKVITLNSYTPRGGLRIHIPEEIKKVMNIGKDTPFIRARIFRIGRDLLIRPITLSESADKNRCAHCMKSLTKIHHLSKPCTTKLDNLIFYFCSKGHRKRWRKENIGYGGKDATL